MIPNNFSRKKRELKALAEKLLRLSLHHRVDTGAQIEKLIRKIKTLVQELAHVLSRTELKKILGTVAILIGISFSNKTNAQSFAAPLANPFGLESANYFGFPVFADLDGDGDTDLLVGEYYGILKYFQNTGTAYSPQFADPQVNPFGLFENNSFAIPALADLDGDGDMDLLVGSNSGRMKYFQNTGSISEPQFAEPLLNPFGLVSTYEVAIPTFTDLDSDGDMDLLVGEAYGAMIYFQIQDQSLLRNLQHPRLTHSV